MNLRSCIVGVSASALGACSALAPQQPVPPAPPLELLSAAPVALAQDCAASGSYIVEFTVDLLGRTTDIAPPEGPACVREALVAWAASFRFAPPATPTSGSIEWLLVTAPKGS